MNIDLNEDKKSEIEEQGFNNSNFIEDLLNEDFVDLNPNRDIYTVTFAFPMELKDTINNYIKINGKEPIVEMIIKVVEQCQIAEAK